MRVKGDWVSSPATQAVMMMLEEAGFQAYFVGGCVRNALLSAEVKDIDITTDARPETVMELAKTRALKAIPTGFDHGTITVVSDHVPHEVTTFRQDVETTGRHAVIAFSDNIEQDAKRRDFTMNALYADRSGSVLDPLGGLNDLRARRVRFIEDPHQRIQEDYLRILRFFRFHAWYGDPAEGMDEDALAAIAANVDGIARLSRERIGAEIMRLLAAPDPAPALAGMRMSGVLGAVLPGAEDRAIAPLIHLEQEHQIAPEPLRRLAVLGVRDPQDLLRLSKAKAKTLVTMRDELGKATPEVELGYRHGDAMGRSICLGRAAVLEHPLGAAAFEDIARGASAKFPVTAADLMPRYSGPALGKRLEELEGAWLASDLALDREELLALDE